MKLPDVLLMLDKGFVVIQRRTLRAGRLKLTLQCLDARGGIVGAALRGLQNLKGVLG